MDEFDQYKVKKQEDEFEQYRVKKRKPIWHGPAKAGLETLGTLGGATLGTTTAGPLGGVAGAGLGYAASKKVEELVGLEPKSSGPLEAGEKLGKEFVTGASMEIMGQGGAAALSAGGRLVARLGRRGFEALMKVPPSVPESIRQKAITTALEGKYYPTEKGLAKLRSDIDTLNEQIAREIEASTRAGKKIDMKDAVKTLDELKSFYDKLAPGRAKEFVDQIDAIKDQYLTAGEITPKAAQEMKRAIYRLHRKHYGEFIL